MASTGADSRPSDSKITLEQLRAYYELAKTSPASIEDIIRVMDLLSSISSSEEATTADLQAQIDILKQALLVNSSNILYLHRLIGLLTFELIEQGVKIESKELINQIEYIQ